jgi:hypothetical protein
MFYTFSDIFYIFKENKQYENKNTVSCYCFGGTWFCVL